MSDVGGQAPTPTGQAPSAIAAAMLRFMGRGNWWGIRYSTCAHIRVARTLLSAKTLPLEKLSA